MLRKDPMYASVLAMLTMHPPGDIGADRLAKDQGCGDIHLKGPIPGIESHFFERLFLENPCIVDQGTEGKFIPDLTGKVQRFRSVRQIDLSYVHPVRSHQLLSRHRDRCCR